MFLNYKRQMKKIIAQEGTAASFGFDLCERKPWGSLSAKLNDKNMSYFRITRAMSSTLLFTLFVPSSFRVPRLLIPLFCFNKRFLRNIKTSSFVPSFPSQILFHALCIVITRHSFYTKKWNDVSHRSVDEYIHRWIRTNRNKQRIAR